MKYTRGFCSKCGTYTLHFGKPYAIHCIRHTADEELENQIVHHEFDDKTQNILRTAVDWTYMYLEKKEKQGV